ncbi:nitrogen fixation protein FixH [Loktanella ponticola]|uniref:Nitrogen fixation protein FixH n=1 Tax=Yoonia ponticola TaxID=1524255 RepID=A0A7W9BLB3_9RHOB|nr:nitrogen fixation protein FixH [Yoonia ponticola]
MTATTGKPLTGRKVLLIMCSAFAVIIGVNLTLAYKAVSTFPGLETKNSYVSSQTFDANRAAQEALNWDVAAFVEAGQLRLSIMQDGVPVVVDIQSAVLGRATNVAQDQTPVLAFDGQHYVAPVSLAKGNWNLRLVALAEDGTTFQQRIIVRTQE